MFNKTHLASLKKVSAYLNNKKKQRILELLDKHGTLTVSELVKLTKWQQAEVSRHLSELLNIDIVRLTVAGRYHCYSIDNKRNYQTVLETVSLVSKK